MRVGDSVTQKVTCLGNQIVPVVQTGVFMAPDVDGCCFKLPAFGDEHSDDELKNDFPRFLKEFEPSTTAVAMILTKPLDSTVADIPLVDDTLGTFYALGFHTDTLGRNYVGFELDMKKILVAHGEGSYQIKYVATTILGVLDPQYDFCYYLQQFTDERADGTIRIGFENSYVLGDRYSFTNRIYFPPKWVNQIRLEGWFGGDNQDYEITETKYKNESLQEYKNRRIPNYRMRIDLAPAEVHRLVQSEVAQADYKDCTDYNRNNPWGHAVTPIRQPSDYKPTDTETELRMTVTLKWKAYYDTGLKIFCNN